MQPSGTLDTEFLDTNVAYPACLVTTTFQSLILVANRYQHFIQHKNGDRNNHYRSYCPILICLVFCCHKDMVEFQRRWGNTFSLKDFYSRCCPRDRTNTRCGKVEPSPHLTINFEPVLDKKGRIDFPGRLQIRDTNTVGLLFVRQMTY